MQISTPVRSAAVAFTIFAGLGLTESARAVSLSNEVLNNSSGYTSLSVGADNAVGLEYIGFASIVGAGGDANPLPIQYTQAGATIDIHSWAVQGAERGAGQKLQVNGYPNVSGNSSNLFLQGQPNVNNPGFGAHANWIVTFDLNEIRANGLGGSSAPLNVTGDYGTWGAIEGTAATDGITQGVIFLDGTRIDSMGQTVSNPNGSEVNQHFDLNITSGRYLSFGIFNGNDGQTNNTVWDDAVYQNVNVTVATPEPASLGILALASVGLFGRRRRI